jgi:hypothetical protein
VLIGSRAVSVGVENAGEYYHASTMIRPMRLSGCPSVRSLIAQGCGILYSRRPWSTERKCDCRHSRILKRGNTLLLCEVVKRIPSTCRQQRGVSSASPVRSL